MIVRTLSNACFTEIATVRFIEGQPGWDEAYANWIKGKNPSSSPEWKRGVFLKFWFGYVVPDRIVIIESKLDKRMLESLVATSQRRLAPALKREIHASLAS